MVHSISFSPTRAVLLATIELGFGQEVGFLSKVYNSIEYCALEVLSGLLIIPSCFLSYTNRLASTLCVYYHLHEP